MKNSMATTFAVAYVFFFTSNLLTALLTKY